MTKRIPGAVKGRPVSQEKKDKATEKEHRFTFLNSIDRLYPDEIPVRFTPIEETSCVTELSELQLDDREIAVFINTDDQYVKETYRRVIDRNRIKGKVKLLMRQFEKAYDGNSNILMWLGKHYLNQKDDVKLTSIEPEVRLLFQELESLTYGEVNELKQSSRDVVCIDTEKSDE